MSRSRIASTSPDQSPAPNAAADPRLEPSSRPAQITLMGLPLDMYTPSTLIRRLTADSQARRGGYVMTPNLDHLRSVTRSDHLMGLALDADIRVADGMPLLWASRLQGTPLPARVTGSDLIFSLSKALATAGRSVYLLGGNPGTANAAGEILQRHADGLRVVGTYCPPYGFEHLAAELEGIDAALRAAQPDFVFVGLPFGKASELVATVRRSLPATWFLGLGVSFSFVCGEVRRAPRWMQRLGLEWLYRLLQEPRRLSRRYMFEGLPFAVRLLWSSCQKRRSPLRDGERNSTDADGSGDTSPRRDTESLSAPAMTGVAAVRDYRRDSASSRL